MRKRWPLLVMVGVGVLLWHTGLFGVLPTERTVVWRFPVSYGDVRKIELQVWEGDELLKREEQTLTDRGLVGEPQFKVPLSSGAHSAIATIWLEGATQSQSFRRDFKPGTDETLVLEMKR